MALQDETELSKLRLAKLERDDPEAYLEYAAKRRKAKKKERGTRDNPKCKPKNYQCRGSNGVACIPQSKGCKSSLDSKKIPPKRRKYIDAVMSELKAKGKNPPIARIGRKLGAKRAQLTPEQYQKALELNISGRKLQAGDVSRAELRAIGVDVDGLTGKRKPPTQTASNEVKRSPLSTIRKIKQEMDDPGDPGALRGSLEDDLKMDDAKAQTDKFRRDAQAKEDQKRIEDMSVDELIAEAERVSKRSEESAIPSDIQDEIDAANRSDAENLQLKRDTIALERAYARADDEGARQILDRIRRGGSERQGMDQILQDRRKRRQKEFPIQTDFNRKTGQYETSSLIPRGMSKQERASMIALAEDRGVRFARGRLYFDDPQQAKEFSEIAMKNVRPSGTVSSDDQRQAAAERAKEAESVPDILKPRYLRESRVLEAVADLQDAGNSMFDGVRSAKDINALDAVLRRGSMLPELKSKDLNGLTPRDPEEFRAREALERYLGGKDEPIPLDNPEILSAFSTFARGLKNQSQTLASATQRNFIGQYNLLQDVRDLGFDALNSREVDAVVQLYRGVAESTE